MHLTTYKVAYKVPYARRTLEGTYRTFKHDCTCVCQLMTLWYTTGCTRDGGGRREVLRSYCTSTEMVDTVFTAWPIIFMT